jgi:dUTP pyrophosphatase
MNKFEKISKAQFFKDFAEYLDDECLDTRDSEAIYNLIKIPKRATTGSAGYDIFAPFDITIPPKGTIKVPTGIRILLDDDKFLAIYPRSGLGFKYKMQLWNTIPVIDTDYSGSDNEGHIWVKFYNDSPEGKTIAIKQGEGMCQSIIQQFFKVDDDKTDGIRNGGMGSTTK